MVNTLAWNNKIGLVAYFVGLCAKVMMNGVGGIRI